MVLFIIYFNYNILNINKRDILIFYSALFSALFPAYQKTADTKKERTG